MKGLFIMGIMMLVLAVSAFAANGNNNQVLGNTCGTVTPDSRNQCCQNKGFQTFDVNEQKCRLDVSIEKVADHESLYKVNITGLQNAMIRVRSNETAMHLQQVMAKIQNKTITKLLEMKNVTFTVDDDGQVVVEGRKNAKLFGFLNMEKKYYCKVLENGTAQRQRIIFEYLFKDIDKNPCEVAA
jgi:hypothetical protein